MRAGQWDDPERQYYPWERSSYFVAKDPPRGSNWSWLQGRSWAQKWVISMSLGPWKLERTEQVRDDVLKALGRRRLRDLTRAHRLPFPRLGGDWQWEWTVRLAEHLRRLKVSESAFFRWLRRMDGGGMEARGALRSVCGAFGPHKTIDYFVPEALEMDTIPVDRHVRRILKKAQLDNVADNELISACKAVGVDPRRFARALYLALTPPE